MSEKNKKAPSKKETPLEKTDRLLRSVEDAMNKHIQFYYKEEGIRKGVEYPSRLDQILDSFTDLHNRKKDSTVVNDLTELMAQLAKMHYEIGGGKDPDGIDILDKASRDAHKFTGSGNFCRGLEMIMTAYDELKALIEDPNITNAVKKKIIKEVQDFHEKCKKRGAASAKKDQKEAGITKFYAALEKISRILSLMTETIFAIFTWQSKGGEGKGPWICIGFYKDGGKTRPIMERAGGTGPIGIA
jgi:hypothetical protein